MDSKKSLSIILLFLVLWIIFIGWGIVKTTLQLSQQKDTPEEPAQKQEITQPLTKIMPTEEAGVEKVPEEEKIAPILVRTFKVKPTDFTDILPVMGTVKGETEIELKFEINGTIESICFREGEKVKKGDLIASLNPKDGQLKLEYAKNKLISAQASYDSVLKKLEIHQKLYQAGAIIKSKVEEIELECESAKFQVETIKSEEKLAQHELEKSNLFAPIDGVIGKREAEEGEFVTPQDAVATLLEIDDVLVEVGIVERDIDKIKLGQEAKLFVDAYPNLTFAGVIENIFPLVEGKSRTLTAKIKINNPDGLLLPGMFCRAEVSIIELKNALLIPSTSLIPAGGGITLAPVIPTQSIRIGEDEVKTGTVVLRQVTVGYMTSDYSQITQGLAENELVVIEARGELKDKAAVRISATEEMGF